MMLKYLLVASALTLATPALADNDNFVGPRVGVSAGVNDITNSVDVDEVVYSADVGVDFPLGENATFGVEAFSENVFDDNRTLGAAARLGYAVSDNALLFTRAGYTNYSDVLSGDLDGLTVGGGVEVAFTENLYTKVEYRYSDFEQNIGSHGALIGVGLRF